MTVKINADTSDGLKLTSDTSGEIDLQTNGTTKVHMDSSGQIGIGTTSPSGSLHINTSSANILIADTDDSNGSYSRVRADASGNLILEADVGNVTASSGMRFLVDNTEHMRVLSSGKFCFDSTSAESTSQDNLQIDPEGHMYFYQNTTALQGLLDFRNPNGYIGSIQTTGSETRFNTSSDYRMKSNINYTWTATDTVKALQPCTFTFNGDTDTTCYGFIAHELQEHIPQAVSGVKDAVKIDGNGDEIIDPQGVDLGKIVPFLVKTIQELEARITALESE